ncbi:MAG: ABC transporter substrate-binding protein [Thermoleophilia bacterium]
MTGRYAAQGAQIVHALELYARVEGIMAFEDDGSDPRRAPGRTRAAKPRRRCDVVLGPYGSDSAPRSPTRQVDVTALEPRRRRTTWKRLPDVVSVASPASGYLVATAEVVAARRPGARVAVGLAAGRFAGLAGDGLLAAAAGLGIRIVAVLPLDAGAGALLASSPDAVLLCGPLDREAPVVAELADAAPDVLLGGLSPGVDGFAAAAGGDVEGVLAPVQWHADAAPGAPELGPAAGQLAPSTEEIDRLDYVGIQAIAAAVVARHCHAAVPDDPAAAARQLDTTTVLGRFRLDPVTGVQVGHRLTVIERRGGRRLLAPAG